MCLVVIVVKKRGRCAISLRELSVCAIFYAFYNYGLQRYMYLSLFRPWPSQKTEAQIAYLSLP